MACSRLSYRETDVRRNRWFSSSSVSTAKRSLRHSPAAGRLARLYRHRRPSPPRLAEGRPSARVGNGHFAAAPCRNSATSSTECLREIMNPKYPRSTSSLSVEVSNSNNRLLRSPPGVFLLHGSDRDPIHLSTIWLPRTPAARKDRPTRCVQHAAPPCTGHYCNASPPVAETTSQIAAISASPTITGTMTGTH